MNTTMKNVRQNWEPRSGDRHAGIDTIGCAFGRVRIVLTLAVCLCSAMTGGARAETNVLTSGNFAPSANGAAYRIVEAAAADPNANRIIIDAGTYKEAFIADLPCILESDPRGVATIGDLSAVATTTLKIATLNTHLFGDELIPGILGFKWQDDNRAIDIAEICEASDWDVVAFQEIWDEDLFLGGDENQDGILPMSGFSDGHHGDDKECSTYDFLCANSGLAMMSRQNMTNKKQEFFWDCSGNPCEGDDCLASKGWIEGQIVKDGFKIHIFNTHTQAYNEPDEVIARGEQLDCMLDRVESVWRAETDKTVVIVGDLNVDGASVEYRFNLQNKLANHGLTARDEARNAPGYVEDEHYTNSPENDLSICFDPETFAARLDYVIVIPPKDSDRFTVIPKSVDVVRFQGRNLTGICSAQFFQSIEKSDHWAVEAEIKFFRNY